MRRILTIAIGVPLVIVIVTFAVANRAPITLSLDPFDSAHPALAVTVPLFILVFILVGLGVVVGGVAAWLKQYRWRLRARHAEAEARQLRARLEAERPVRAVSAPIQPPPFAVPPAA